MDGCRAGLVADRHSSASRWGRGGCSLVSLIQTIMQVAERILA